MYLHVSGHLHIQVDELPWWWADASDNNTVDIAGLPPGQHKVKIELVDAKQRYCRTGGHAALHSARQSVWFPLKARSPCECTSWWPEKWVRKAVHFS